MGRRQTMELRHAVDGVAFSFKDCISRGAEWESAPAAYKWDWVCFAGRFTPRPRGMKRKHLPTNH
jgi:hypothetical protein